MAVSTGCGVLLAVVLVIRALLFGVYVRAPECWKLPYGEASDLRGMWI